MEEGKFKAEILQFLFREYLNESSKQTRNLSTLRFMESLFRKIEDLGVRTINIK